MHDSQRQLHVAKFLHMTVSASSMWPGSQAYPCTTVPRDHFLGTSDHDFAPHASDTFVIPRARCR